MPQMVLWPERKRLKKVDTFFSEQHRFYWAKLNHTVHHHPPPPKTGTIFVLLSYSTSTFTKI
jgi:hypothetical protein